MRGTTAQTAGFLAQLSVPLAAFALVACASAGGEEIPPGEGEDDGDVPVMMIDAAIESIDAGSVGTASVALVTPEIISVAHGFSATVTVILDRPAGITGAAVA